MSQITEQVRSIAFYLPQFHPIPENDVWWGKGFTEWTNVVRARPLTSGHYQPHLPVDLGFYDLRLGEVRKAQADLAREHGIHGFCYYHYWFGGRRLLERPVNEVLQSGEPNFPFCLCWANENWSRRWDGSETEILMHQEYSPDDDRTHLRWLARAFQDTRYIRIGGKPLFLVYKASSLPDAGETIRIWRNEAMRLGIGELFLCNVESTEAEHGICRMHGFDAAVEFAPDWTVSSPPMRREIWWRVLARLGLGQRAFMHNSLRRYDKLVENMLAKAAVDYVRFPGVTPAWDNTARRKKGATVFIGSTPELYERWLRVAIDRTRGNPPGENLVFINAWNEWAEGNHLEPCQKWGHAYLEATRRALTSAGCFDTPISNASNPPNDR